MTTNISTRGRTFTGTVTSDKMSKTVTVTWTRRHYIPKYERYERRRTKVKAHNPDEIDARIGDRVIIMETRPLSKTKNFIVIKKLTGETTTVVATQEQPAKKTPAKTATKKPATKKPTKKDATLTSEEA